MGEIVNLKRKRKERARAEKQARATQNRTRHGRSKAQKHGQTAEKARLEHLVAAHRRDSTEPPEEP